MDFSEEMVDEILKIFQVESEEIISRLNNNFYCLEKDPENKDTILLLFRDAHTLKGASRMVGFNSVQEISHKLEDVLGLAKDGKISLNSNIINIFYKTTDFLSEIIQKSIVKGKEIYSEDISKQIEILNNIERDFDNIPVKVEKTDFNPEIFNQNINKINTLLPQCLLILMHIEAKQNEQLIQKLFAIMEELYDIFSFVGPYDVKKMFEDIKVKLEFISKTLSVLTIDEIEEIHKVINNTIDKLASCCELNNIKLIDFYSVAFSMLQEEPSINEQIQETENIIVEQKTIEPIIEEQFEGEQKDQLQEALIINLLYIQNKINGLLNNSGSINDIIKDLVSFVQNCQNENIKNILNLIVNIMDFTVVNGIKPDEETISVLSQSVEYCDNLEQGKSDSSDINLILQRLEIIQQVLSFNIEKPNIDKFTILREKATDKKITDFSDFFTAEEIKTLRVDSSKLDTIVNQFNELAITKIKTQKHLHELNSISRGLKEWQKDSIKTLNYLKYYDKKYFKLLNDNNPISVFIKQLLHSFTENNKKVFETVSSISTLQKIIQEDDSKTTVIIDNLERMVKNIRVLPLATIFHLFGRMVRDIAQEKNKQIDFEIIGSETTTDKKIIEEIKAPLIHIIRNSIDHGIETPEERANMGKNPVGKIVLSARQANNKVIIEITDDGRGINIEKVKEKALQKGFLTGEELESMTDEQIMNIIFAPGFSTGDEITSISGRGIGLDIVQSKISQLNGKVRVLSELNKGCCVQIELPTSMAILKAFLVKSSNQTFAIPMEAIKTVLRKKTDEIINGSNGQSIVYKEETISLYNLANILNLPKLSSDKIKETILILESDGKTIALSVDKLIGDQEILHKKLSAPIYKLKNIAGITTLASGEICLILNISDIMKVKPAMKRFSNTKTANLPLLNSDFKILLVDDSITTRTLEKNILTKIGYNIETAENPKEAFEKMKNTKFDLIITDIEMPEMNGFEFLEKLKTDEMFNDIPVIMVSSLITEENKKRSQELGAEKYIVKGEFNQDDFKETINTILRKNE